MEREDERMEEAIINFTVCFRYVRIQKRRLSP